MKDDYKELQKIYEGYGGQFTDTMVAGQLAAQQDNTSYGKGRLPLAYPGSGGNNYARGEAGAYQVPNVFVISDEEVQVKDIENQIVIDKIDEYMEQALEDEMMYAVHSLGQLKEYVKSL
jgi:hypothetical protein